MVKGSFTYCDGIRDYLFLSYATPMPPAYTPKLLDTIQACPAADWNDLLDADETQAGRVFVRHEFLAALEDTPTFDPVAP